MEAIILPEIVLFRVVNGMLIHLRKDYEEATDKTTTKIHRLFHGQEAQKFDYEKEAINLFTRATDHARKIEVNLHYNAERSNIPQIHIALMSDQQGANDIGMGEHGHIDSTYVDGNTVTPTYNRRFDAQYMVVCTSDSQSECMLMYRTIQAMLISVADTLGLYGLENVRFSGQELRLNRDIVPQNISVRGVGVQTLHEVKVPRLFDHKTISDIIVSGIVTT